MSKFKISERVKYISDTGRISVIPGIIIEVDDNFNHYRVKWDNGASGNYDESNLISDDRLMTPKFAVNDRVCLPSDVNQEGKVVEVRSENGKFTYGVHWNDGNIYYNFFDEDELWFSIRKEESKPVATFTAIVEFDELPDQDAIDEIVDSMKAYGKINKASLDIHGPVTKEFK